MPTTDSSGEAASQYLRVAFNEESGQYAATFVGMEGVSGTGRTWGEAVDNVRLLLDNPVVAEKLPSRSQFSGRFSVRVASSLHQALDALAQLEGVSLNNFISNALAEKVGFHRDPAHSSPRVIPEETLIGLLPASAAAAGVPEAPSVALRIAHKLVHDLDMPSAALAVAILCGDRLRQTGNNVATADHYGRWAWTAKQHGFTTLALAMWEEGLRVQSEGNHRSKSSYGQLLYELGRYQAAADQLRDVPDREGALTFKKARLRLATADSAARQALMDSIREVMRMWAFGSSSQQEARLWRKHADDLAGMGPDDVAALAAELREFALKNSRWR